MELKPGIKACKEMIVTKELCADAWGSGGLPVYATPAMIALMENTAWASVEPCMEEGRSTVGTKLDVSHLSASPVGARITSLKPKGAGSSSEGKQATMPAL